MTGSLLGRSAENRSAEGLTTERSKRIGGPKARQTACAVVGVRTRGVLTCSKRDSFGSIPKRHVRLTLAPIQCGFSSISAPGGKVKH